ncbi:MAG: PstS family phosphate ABC transporter substrate-binding protein [Pirellulales bacterium]
MTKVKVFAAVLAVIICGSLVVVQALETQATKGSTSKKAVADKASVAGRASVAQSAPQGKVDSKLPRYSLGDGVSGTIKSEGSDTMVKLMQYWTESFQRYYPNVQVEVQGKGSATAPTALIAGTSNFGPMSREMKSKEIDEFEARFGYKPTGLKTGIDMLAVYVHKDNPIKGLTLPQVDAIFSKNRKGGYEKDIRTWGDLGLKGQWANKPISLYGRNSASGTYGYFKENALFDGDFKDSVQERPGSSAVVQGVARNKFAIGYSGIGYKTADVRAVPVAREEGEDFWRAEADYVSEYPLSRFLLIYINYEPRSDLDPLRREFIKYIFSREGQEDVVKDDYLPVGAKMAFDALSSVGITVSQ